MARSVYLVLGIARHAHHRRTQQPVLQPVAALQLVEHVIVLGLVGIHHLNGLVDIGIERLALGRDGLHAQLGQRIMKLLVDELDAGVKIFQRRGVGLQRVVQAIENGQQRLERVGESVVPVFLLRLGVALAEVVELGLQPRRAVKISRALGFDLLQFRLRLVRRDSAGRSARAGSSSSSAGGSSWSSSSSASLELPLCFFACINILYPRALYYICSTSIRSRPGRTAARCTTPR